MAAARESEAADIQKAVEQQQERFKKAKEERSWLIKRGSSGAKLQSSLKLATRRAKKQKNVDICFVFDMTASMEWWLKTAAEKMEEIVLDTMERLGQDAHVRVAFVGYKDYEEENHPIVHPFTSDITKIKAFLRTLEAEGGGDVCEDILTGLQAALELAWCSTSKVLYLLSQTPNHGWRFHSSFHVSTSRKAIEEAVAACEDVPPEERKLVADKVATKCHDLHGDDPRQWQAMDAALAEIQKQGIQMVFLKVGDGSILDKMLHVFRHQYQKDVVDPWLLKVVALDRDVKLFRNVVTSMASASFSASLSRMSRSGAQPLKRLPLTVSHTPPDWSSSGKWTHVQAQLISYEVEDLDSPAKKLSRDCKVAICPTPFGKGAMRFAFYVVDEDHQSCLVGKVYQFDDEAYQSKSTYEGDMMSQAVAQFLAREFSLEYPEMPIEFVQAQLLVLESATTEFPFKFMALEPWIPGRYEKFTSNAGHITADSDLAQAFSHYTFQKSDGEILVSDIQGVQTTLTDPQIHSEDVNRFGRGNLRTKGMDMFFANHVCSDICRTLQLESHPFQPGGQSVLSEMQGRLATLPEDDGASGEPDEPDPHAMSMPLEGSELQRFLDAARHAAKSLLEDDSRTSATTLSGAIVDDLGGAVIEWDPAPKIISVVEGSPACLAGCKQEACLAMVGGTSVKDLGRADILKLLAAEKNMIFTTWSMSRLQEMARLLPERLGVFDSLHELAKLAEACSSDGIADLHGILGHLGLTDLPSIADLEKAKRNGDFLDKVHEDAKLCLQQTQDSPGGSRTSEAAVVDCLAGASFAWTDPPEVIAVEQGSLADGLVKVGQKLHEVGEQKVAGMSRAQILHLLQDCSSMQMQRASIEVSEAASYDPDSGLETSSLGHLRIKWSDPPVIVSDRAEPSGDLLIEIDGTSLVGMTQPEIRSLYLKRTGTGSLSMGKMSALHRVPFLRGDLLRKLKADRHPVHFESTCTGCQASPLVGFRFSCKTCPDSHYCAACFRGRGHSHASGHSFTKLEYPGAPIVDAFPPPALQPGSAVVIVGTGQKDQDGQLGLLLTDATSSASWQVVVDGLDQPCTVAAQHLFLKTESAPQPERLPESKSPAQDSDKLKEPKPEPKEVVCAATPARAAATPRRSKVVEAEVTLSDKSDCESVAGLSRSQSARELRKATATAALQRCRSKGRLSLQKRLCRGKCGEMVEVGTEDYIKNGQFVLCAKCKVKAANSQAKLPCSQCGQDIVYSLFEAECGREIPSCCAKCSGQGAGGWILLSPLPPRKQMPSLE